MPYACSVHAVPRPDVGLYLPIINHRHVSKQTLCGFPRSCYISKREEHAFAKCWTALSTTNGIQGRESSHFTILDGPITRACSRSTKNAQKCFLDLPCTRAWALGSASDDQELPVPRFVNHVAVTRQCQCPPSPVNLSNLGIAPTRRPQGAHRRQMTQREIRCMPAALPGATLRLADRSTATPHQTL